MTNDIEKHSQACIEVLEIMKDFVYCNTDLFFEGDNKQVKYF